MHVLLCTLNSPGYLFPSIRLALTLRERGHEVTFYTDASELLCSLGFRSLLPEPMVSFDPSDWFLPETIAGHMVFLAQSLKSFRPGLILTHQLMLGPILSARESGVALGVIGLAAPVFPLSNEHLEHARLTGSRVVGRYTQLLAIVRRAADVLGRSLPTISPQYFSGDAFLLRSVPELELEAPELPAHVNYAGDLWWEPPYVQDELSEYMKRIHGRRVVYLQPGRTFDESSFAWALACHLQNKYAVVIDSFRSDDIERTLAPSSMLIRPFIPMGRVLPQAVAMVSHGHTTPALAGLRFGVPHLVIPNGSGTEDIAQRLTAINGAHCAQTTDVTEAMERLLQNGQPVPNGWDRALEGAASASALYRALEKLG